MINRLKVVYFNATSGEDPKITTINDDLQEFYRLLNCRAINIVNRIICDVPVCVICDDEGLLKENPTLSAIFYPELARAFVGNLIITGPNDLEGNLTSLSEQDAKRVLLAQAKVNGKLALLFDSYKRG